jgi:predicted ATPase
MMHVQKITIFPEKFPPVDSYPFNLRHLNITRELEFDSTVTFFVGDNGSGKSTLLRAIAHGCGIHIWEPAERSRAQYNMYEHELYRYIEIKWSNGVVPGSYFGSAIFEHFARNLDDWASASPKILDYFGGKSLMTQSHGQCHMSFFESRYKIKGLYLLDEPETALSPKTQLQFLHLLKNMTKEGHAQFIIATHSPILLAAPQATIYSFDYAPVRQISYEDSSHYKIYSDFFKNRENYL